MLPLVTSVAEATAGIRSFYKLRGRYRDVLPHSRAWYAIEVDGGYLLGPSKVIGYRGMTPEVYFQNNATTLDGRATESALQAISEPVLLGSVLHRELLRELSDLCALYGAKPNKLVRFAVVGRAAIARGADEHRFVELVAGTYARMSSKEQAVFRRMTGLSTT